MIFTTTTSSVYNGKGNIKSLHSRPTDLTTNTQKYKLSKDYRPEENDVENQAIFDFARISNPEFESQVMNIIP